MAASQNGDDQAGRIVEGVTGAIGLGYLAVRPMEARQGADPIRSMPEGTLAQKENRPLAAEPLLERNALRAKERSSWKMHPGNVAFNLAAGGFVVGFGNLGDAGILAGSGAVAGALQMWSQPGRPLRDWEEYQKLRSGAAQSPGLDWSLSPTPRGIALRLRF